MPENEVYEPGLLLLTISSYRKGRVTIDEACYHLNIQKYRNFIE
jgi:hypothetical protein